jgi:hypothetical protein
MHCAIAREEISRLSSWLNGKTAHAENPPEKLKSNSGGLITTPEALAE